VLSKEGLTGTLPCRKTATTWLKYWPHEAEGFVVNESVNMTVLVLVLVLVLPSVPYFQELS
jgi:hypothetical protein